MLAVGAAWAALPDEIQVYTDDLAAPGERDLELHVNTTLRGRSTPDYPGEVPPARGIRVTPEVSWGLAPGWDWGLYLPFVRSGAGSEFFAGPRARVKWVPLRPTDGGSGWFAGLNAEVSFVERRFEEARHTLELRPIVGYRNDLWLVSFNPILDTNLSAPGKGVLTFSPAVKLGHAIGENRMAGIEYYADAGRLSHPSPGSQQAHYLYGVLDTKRVNFGVGRGLTGASDRWTVKAIFSF